ncbi:hypothetical protein [Carnobacterium viridans]|uniref:Uncharacterized protein n=1 Tax=Carnobacterium viridans TaxID=174587 RepID=A0A1H0Y2E6_9LACT|nr:hypothetical protein [Carnobacterium viridans]SDQ09231.1 hypothetical protein SAMN04487752_0651 [Carnobacterium viridans]
MKKNKTIFFTKILYGLFLSATTIAVFIVYKNIDNAISFNFLMGYFFFSFFMLIYVSFITIVNIKNFKWVYIRKRIVKFITIFILFSTLNYFFGYIIRPSKIDLFKIFTNSFGISFGIVFSEIIFFKGKNKLK